MGSACSMQRSYEEAAARRRERALRRAQNEQSSSGNKPSHSSLRHAVVTAVPDRVLTTLYPVDENYILNPNGTKTPKSLAELATDAVCRSLVHLDGSLPPRLPPDVVQDICTSLHQHGAWNATTLAVLRQCELERLDLTKAKGVTDEWLHVLTTTTPDDEMRCVPQAPSLVSMHRDSMMMDLDHEEYAATQNNEDDICSMGASSESITSFMSASSNPFTMTDAHGTTTNPEGMIISQQDEADDDNFHSTDMHDALDHKPTAEYHLHNHNQKAYNIIDGGLVTTRMMTVLDLSGSIHLTDKGLAKLQHIERLEEARFDHCHSITGRGLQILASSYHLHTLSLANCRRLTDVGIMHLSNLMSLESLNLAGCRCLTDRSLAAIADLYSLRHLDLSQCDLLTDAGIEQLTSLEHLEEINLGWCRQITDRGLQDLTSQPGRSTLLRRLCLARCGITDGSIECLSRLKALEELNLNGCSNVGSTALGNALQFLPCLSVLDVSYCRGILRSGWQGKINQVKSLDLSYSGVRDSHLNRLSSLTALEELNLDSCPVGDPAFAHLANEEVVPNLTSLDLADTSVTDAGMVHIAKFTKLTRLSLFYCNISNRGLRHISQLKQLQVLNLDSRDISDDGIRYLRDLPNLRSLDIFSGRITDTGCVHISRIKTLESLELCGGAVGDDGCVALASLSGLTRLNLSQNEGITNQGAAALAATLTNLKTLNLSNTGIDSGALRFFTGLTQLYSLALYGCHSMDYPVRIEWLKSRLPNLRCLRVDRIPEQEGKFLVDTSEESSCDEEEMWMSTAHAAAANHDPDDAYSDYD